MRQIRSYLPSLTATAGVVASLLTFPAWAVTFTPTNLVTDDQLAHAAQITDPHLKNAWGMSYAPGGPFWVSSNGDATVRLYGVNPATQATAPRSLTVSDVGSVTGQVFNSTSSFGSNRFLFVSEDGTVSGWRPALGTTGLVPAERLVTASASNVYKGAALGNTGGHDYLYAANFKAGTVDVHKGDAAAPLLSGSFTDPGLPSGYAPFNVQNLDGSLYVTYALQNASKDDDVAGAGLGFVDQYTLNGDFVARVASGGTLNAPWGVAVAPSSFGSAAGDLLVGNFGDGHINIYDPNTHAFLGQVMDANHHPVVIDGLWAISPGNDTMAGSSHLLYFTAGPNDEAHGLFGVLTAVPEPSAYAMMLAGLGALMLLIKRRTLG